jgi:hypothetical protein
MKEKEIYNKKAKEFFNRLGLEKTSSDFTSVVMERIQVEPGIEKSKILPGLPYYYLIAMFFTAGILILPFNSYILDFINDLVNIVINIDYTFINNMIISITDTIIDYAVSSTVLIIFILTAIILLALIFINYSGYRYEIARIQIS